MRSGRRELAEADKNFKDAFVLFGCSARCACFSCESFSDTVKKRVLRDNFPGNDFLWSFFYQEGFSEFAWDFCRSFICGRNAERSYRINEVIEKVIPITNKLGLHARPAALLVQTASVFSCNVRIIKDDVEVNGKSVMGIMMLAAEYGSSLKVITDGRDEADAMSAIEKVFEKKFDDE